jgi:glutathione S-transferase
MKLYDSRRAPNPRRVRWLMAEKGIEDIEVVPLDLLAGDQKKPEYVAMTGVAQAPALTLDDGTTITESVAICRYLESVYPEPNMFGRDPCEIAIFEMWQRRAEMMAALPLMNAVRHGHPALAVLENQVPEVAENSRRGAERAMAFFDRRLGEAEWLAGERISMADGMLFIGLDFARMVRFQPAEEHTNVARWLTAMRERPSASAGT